MVGYVPKALIIVLVIFTFASLNEAQRWRNRYRYRHGAAFNRYAMTSKRNATVTYSFTELSDGKNATVDVEIDGLYALKSIIGNATGRVIHVKTEDGGNEGCTEGVNLPDDGEWVALIKRGGCTFSTKIEHHAVNNKAAAVIIYNNRDEGGLMLMTQPRK